MKIRKRQLGLMFLVAVAAIFSLGGTAASATWTSPTGEWDFTVTGAKKGSAYLSFNSDQTIAGYILVVPSPGNKGGKDHVSTFGFAFLTGQWQFDSRGQIVGFLNNDPSTEVRLDTTSFTGKVKKNGVGFTITGVTEDGKLTFTGVPFQTLTPLPTVWTIQKKAKKRLIFTEIFDAQPDTTVPDHNLYDLFGEGANLCIYGHGVLSKSNNFNVSFVEYPKPDSSDCSDINPATATGVGSAGVGKINLNTGKATLTGAQEGSPSLPVSMPVFCQ